MCKPIVPKWALRVENFADPAEQGDYLAKIYRGESNSKFKMHSKGIGRLYQNTIRTVKI